MGASNNFGEGKDSVKSIATIATWFITGSAYMAIVLFVASYPRLSGEGDGEWTKNPDFGLTNANCYGENPWFTDFEEKIQFGAGFIIFTLNIVNLILVCIQAFVNDRSASKASRDKSIQSVALQMMRLGRRDSATILIVLAFRLARR